MFGTQADTYLVFKSHATGHFWTWDKSWKRRFESRDLPKKVKSKTAKLYVWFLSPRILHRFEKNKYFPAYLSLFFFVSSIYISLECQNDTGASRLAINRCLEELGSGLDSYLEPGATMICNDCEWCRSPLAKCLYTNYRQRKDCSVHTWKPYASTFECEYALGCV